MTTPLTKEERDGIQRYGVTLGEMYARFGDYEATVRAVEAERDAAVSRAGELRDAASEVRSYWGIEGEPGYQEAMTRLAQALAADDAERGDG